MKRALILIAALGLALLAGILISRPLRDLRPAVSALPEFDSATFIPFVEGVCPVVKIEGVEAQRLRAIFEGHPVEKDLKEWVVIGELTLLREGAEVLKMAVFSSRSGPGPFAFSGGEYHSGYDQAAFRKLLRSIGWVLTPKGWERSPGNDSVPALRGD
jgi:hypothetical protein